MRRHLLAGIVCSALLAQAAGADPVMAPVGERSVSVINRGPTSVQELYISPKTTPTWGVDRLADKSLDPGQASRIKLGRMRDCAFDVLAVYDDARQQQIRDVDVCREKQVTLSGAEAAPLRRMTLVNANRLPIQQFYVSAPDAAEWGVDRLALASVSVAEERLVEFTGSCRADVRVVFANKAAEERRALDLCANPSLRVAPGWTTEARGDTEN